MTERTAHSGGEILFTIEVQSDRDMVLARRRTMEVAERLGLSEQQQLQLAAATAEVARTTLERGAGGQISFRVAGADPRLVVEVQDHSPGPPKGLEVEGQPNAERLMDHLLVASASDDTIVLSQHLPTNSEDLAQADLQEIAREVVDLEPAPLVQEVQRHNQELLVTLEELQLKAAEWQATFDAIPDALCVLDGQTAVLHANQAMIAFLDRGLKEVLGRRWGEVCPDQLAIDDLLERARATSCREGKDVQLHGRWYRAQADAVLSEAGAVERFILLVVDITEERHNHEQLVASEGRLRAIIGHSRVGLWLLPADHGAAPDAGLVECSPDLERFLGLSRAELQRAALAELIHPDDREQEQQLRAALLSGEQAHYEQELRFLHASGAVLWGHVAVSPIRAPGGAITSLVYTIVDVTRRKQTELRLTQINETLKSFAHTVSHDLKGPLSGAITANRVLNKLLQQPLTERSKQSVAELAGVFSTSVGRSIDLVNELLTLAEAGHDPGGKTSADLREVIEQVRRDQAAVIQERGARLLSGDDLGRMPVAPAHAYQILANLIGNAIQHNPGPAPTIWIERLAGTEEQTRRLRVRDNGPGIPEALLGSLFEPFVRGAAGTSGLGLATVRRIVQIYGGEIHVENAADGGACFELFVRDLTS